jgi:hypothetical protein
MALRKNFKMTTSAPRSRAGSASSSALSELLRSPSPPSDWEESPAGGIQVCVPFLFALRKSLYGLYGSLLLP